MNGILWDWVRIHSARLRMAVLLPGAAAATILAIEDSSSGRIPWAILALIAFGSCIETLLEMRMHARTRMTGKGERC